MTKPITLMVLVALLLGGCTDISDTRPDVVRKSEYYLESGVEAYNNSDYVGAADLFGKALAHYRSIDDAYGTLLSLINLAETALAIGQHETALEQLAQAETVARQRGVARYDQRIHLLRSQALWASGDFDNARQTLTPLLPSFSDDNEPEQSPTHITVAALVLRTELALSRKPPSIPEVRLWLERLNNAITDVDEASPIELARRDRLEARLRLRSGDNAAAHTLLKNALAQYQQGIHRPAIAATLVELATLHMSEKQWSSAIDKLERALYIRLWIMDRAGSEEALRLLADAYEQNGDAERAGQALEQADAIVRDDSALQSVRERYLP